MTPWTYKRSPPSGKRWSGWSAQAAAPLYRAFFLEAFCSVGGKIRPRETGRYEITFVPAAVRSRDMQIGFGEPVLQRYERVCFEKERCNVQGMIPAELLCPGHPLLEAVIDLVRERNAEVLKQDTIFVDDSDDSTDPGCCFTSRMAIQDGVLLPGGTKRSSPSTSTLWS